MKTLLVATQNRGKWLEFRRLLGGLDLAAIPENSVPEVTEDGTTYFENALKKATAYQNYFKMPVLADDSGVEVAALEGRPGVLSARYGGESISWPERWDKLNRELVTVKASSMAARFVCVLCYWDGIDEPRFFLGTSEGEILKSPAGKKGFGYDPIFYSSEIGKSWGEATDSEKDGISHRARACKKFLNWSRLSDSIA